VQNQSFKVSLIWFSEIVVVQRPGLMSTVPFETLVGPFGQPIRVILRCSFELGSLLVWHLVWTGIPWVPQKKSQHKTNPNL
jgi:hypothetical protein